MSPNRPAGPSAELVRWPSEADRRNRLARLGVPRLLVIDDGAEPPVVDLEGEDWCWVSSDERDVAARLEQLRVTTKGAGTNAPLAGLSPTSVLAVLAGGAWGGAS